MPFSFSTFAIVVLATLWPSPFSSPWIRQYPHEEFSKAIRTMRDLIAFIRPGRPTRFVAL
jgi:hypothetical protein